MDTDDLESTFAGRWLHILGLILVFLGTAFFLKVAFDHHWIEAGWRVVLGLSVGTATIGYAQILAHKGKRFFSEGITALGVGIEYVTLYSASAVLNVATPEMTLAGMIAVTALVAALSWRHKSERLALMAAIGGFATPMLVGTLSDNQWMLATYLVVLTSCLLLLAELLDSRIITPLAAAACLLYGFTSFWNSHALTDPQRAAIFAMLYASFAIGGWVATKRHGSLDRVRSIVGGVAVGALILGLDASLSAEFRYLLSGSLIVLALAHLGAAIALRSRYHSWLATAAVTFAVPAGFDRNVIGVAWAAEAATLAIAGLRYRDKALQCASFALLSVVLVRDYGIYTNLPQTIPFLNERFAAAASAFAAMYAIVYAVEQWGMEKSSELAQGLRGVAHLVALLALGAEAWTAVHYFGGTDQGAQAALSVVMAIFASLLIGSGLRKCDRIIRYEGLALIVLTAAKVLIVDLSFLDISYHVISAVLVGVALIGVSYAYQRRIKAAELAQ